MTHFLSTAALAGALAFSPMVATSANAVVLLFDVSGIFSNELAGDALNEVFTVNIGANSHVIGIGWDVTLFADSPSYLSEAVVRFGSTSTNFAVDLTVGVGDDFPGVDSYSSGGIVSLVDLGFDYFVDGDGLLRLEFYEAFDDFPNDWDAIWESGVISIEYTPTDAVIPEPATWAMMIAGFGLVGFAARRRRSLVAQA